MRRCRAARSSSASTGCTLDGADRERLVHPLVGGVILFARNFEIVRATAALTGEIRALRTPALLDRRRSRRRARAAVPGRVHARYRRCARWASMWDRDVARPRPRGAARRAARSPRELRAQRRGFQLHAGARCRLRRQRGDRRSRVHRMIRMRSRISPSRSAAACATAGVPPSASTFRDMASSRRTRISKFPVDDRPLSDLLAERPRSVRRAVREPASRRSCRRTWSIPPSTTIPRAFRASGCRRSCAGGSVRRTRLLRRSRHGRRQAAGDIVARAEASLAAGCDMVLACNEPEAADELLSRWRPAPSPQLAQRTARMAGR